MNAKKLPSGSWSARLFLGEDENGKKHYKSFTAATKREAERLALNYAEERATPDRITFKDALARYIESKSNVFSPSTLRGYRQMFDITCLVDPGICMELTKSRGVNRSEHCYAEQDAPL